MATKKKEDLPVTNSNINTNNNTNHVNVNVKLEQPKKTTKSNIQAKSKPNWVVKTIVVGLIGVLLSILGIYLKNRLSDASGRPAEIENGMQPISGNKAN
jgi:hypothetical protein